MNTIPKTIHYCWFGGNPLPESAQKCIESWRKYLPDYEIKEWNESNYDVHKIPYIHEAYEAKKFAFVSDFARFDILYQYGGVYFDTDVEVIKPLNDILERGSFMGVETPAVEGVKPPRVAPGLGIATEAGSSFYKELIDYYQTIHFLNEDGKPNEVTIVEHTTKLLVSQGMKAVNTLQQVSNQWIYPADYFNPLNDNTGVLHITDNTRSIHWFSKSWMSLKQIRRNKITRIIHRWFGVNSLSRIKKLLKK